MEEDMLKDGLYKKIQILIFSMFMLLIFSCASFSTKFYYDLNEEGLDDFIEKYQGKEFIYLPENVSIYNLEVIDMEEIYVLTEILIDRAAPKTLNITFTDENGEKKTLDFEVIVYTSAYDEGLFGKYTICLYNRGYNWYNYYAIGGTFAKGFHPMERFRVAYQEAYQKNIEQRIRQNEIAENRRLAGLYGGNEYIDFRDEIREWERLMIVLTGETPDMGWEYPTSNSIYYMPVLKVNIVEGYEPNIYFLEYKSTDFGVRSPYGYTYYKRFAVRDTIGLVKLIDSRRTNTANLGVVIDNAYGITTSFLLKVGGRTNIQYRNGERQWVYLFETVPFHQNDPNKPK